MLSRSGREEWTKSQSVVNEGRLGWWKVDKKKTIITKAFFETTIRGQVESRNGITSGFLDAKEVEWTAFPSPGLEQGSRV